MTERWETIEAITAARRRFEAAIPGWQAPAAYGVARDTPDGPEFAGQCRGACVADGGTGERLRAYQQVGLVPAERRRSGAGRGTAATGGRVYRGREHPNSAAWQWLHADLAAGEQVVAFAATLTETSDDRYVAALLATVLAGRVENPAGSRTRAGRRPCGGRSARSSWS
ncbi:MAG: hypothetical protein HKP61_15665 [Dactylosporangium sp.]|nr:hypothetical protein [Dactylosporangium sp.]NNJ62343.1 hypothetical protein [Dactylosporangium sp.]